MHVHLIFLISIVPHTLVLGGILGAAILDSVTGRKKLGDLGANMLGET